MKIALIVEGKTEKAFLPHVRTFLAQRLAGQMPKLFPVPYDGRIPTGEKLRKVVNLLLSDRYRPADAVIALTDVYTGVPGEFTDASDAKQKMRSWVGGDGRFHPHAAQYDFEAWLLPFWGEIQRLAGHNQAPLAANPETINHTKPPSYRLKEMFLAGSRRRAYVKARDANRILRGNDLQVSARVCPELKSFLNTILGLCGATVIP
jgi:hypothetical protein